MNYFLRENYSKSITKKRYKTLFILLYGDCKLNFYAKYNKFLRSGRFIVGIVCFNNFCEELRMNVPQNNFYTQSLRAVTAGTKSLNPGFASNRQRFVVGLGN